MVLRGGHRDVRADPPGLEPAQRRGRAVPRNDDADAHAAGDVRQPAAQAALPAIPGPAHPAGAGGGAAPRALGRRARGGASLSRTLPAGARFPFPQARRQPRARVQGSPGRREPGGARLRRDARVPAADAHPQRRPRAGGDRHRGRHAPSRPPAERLLAAGVRLSPRHGPRAGRGGNPLLPRGRARDPERLPRFAARRPRAGRLSLRRGGVRARPRILQAGLELRGRLSRRRRLPRVLPRPGLRRQLRLHRAVPA